jgi:hypothetical protein
MNYFFVEYFLDFGLDFILSFLFFQSLFILLFLPIFFHTVFNFLLSSFTMIILELLVLPRTLSFMLDESRWIYFLSRIIFILGSLFYYFFFCILDAFNIYLFKMILSYRIGLF